MIIGTPHKIYNQDAAARLLDMYPKSDVNQAITSLMNEKVILKQSAAETARFFGFVA